jgi:hypothetical protein
MMPVIPFSTVSRVYASFVKYRDNVEAASKSSAAFIMRADLSRSSTEFIDASGNGSVITRFGENAHKDSSVFLQKHNSSFSTGANSGFYVDSGDRLNGLMNKGFTVCGWFLLNKNTSGATIISKIKPYPDGLYDGGFDLIYYASAFQFSFKSASGQPISSITIPPPPIKNEFVHIAVTLTSDGLFTLYVNGNKNAESTSIKVYSPFIDDDNAEFMVGGRNSLGYDQGPLVGNFDEVGCYPGQVLWDGPFIPPLFLR